MNSLMTGLPEPLRTTGYITCYALIPIIVYLLAQLVYVLVLGIWFSRKLERDETITIPAWCLKVDRVMWIKSSELYSPQAYTNFPLRKSRSKNKERGYTSHHTP